MLPDYKKNSLVNLMSAILHGFGVKSKYLPLEDINNDIRKTTNTILLVIDAMGLDSLNKLPPKSFLRKNFYRKITSVFPSTTASAITTFYTGLAPQEHGVTGWDMHMKEFSSVISILPSKTKQGAKIELGNGNIHLPRSILKKINAECYNILPKICLKSSYNKIMGIGAKNEGINTFLGLTNRITKIIKSNNNKKYVYAYWDQFDSLSHKYGKNGKNAKEHLLALNNHIEKLVKRLKGTDTLFLITADHGQVETSKKNQIILNKHPLLRDCLSTLICGEPRATYCYVYPDKTHQFEEYVKKKFKNQCTLHKSKDIVKNYYYGLGKPHPRLFDRIGDYILIAKKNYVFRELLPYHELKERVGFHGGISEEEMSIPLIKLKIN